MTKTIEYTDVDDCVDSSAIEALYYNKDLGRVFVVFPGQGVFSYPVTPQGWNAWVTAQSKGRFYHDHVKGNSGGIHEGYFNEVNFVRATVAPAPLSNGTTYTFTGTVTSVISGDVEVNAGAYSLERALSAFKSENPGVEVTGITARPRA